jgi:hypothetical protein
MHLRIGGLGREYVDHLPVAGEYKYLVAESCVRAQKFCRRFGTVLIKINQDVIGEQG